MTEGPYKLPEGWRWVRLGEVCKPTERRDPTKEPESTFQYVDISSVDNATGEIIGAKELLGKEAPSRARKVIRSNDVIFATTRPYLKNIAIVPPELHGQICSTGFCVLRANEAILEPRFLFYVCRSDLVVEQLSQGNMRGASYPAVTDKDVFDSVIPLPPLAEQRRIVARIEELMDRVREARRLREEAQKDAERLWQSVLAQTFPRPGSELPEGWRWVRLEEVFRLRNGKFIRGGDLSTGGSVPVYGANGLLGFTATPLLTQGKTIVIGRVGACGAVNVVEAPCWISDNAMFVSQWYTDCDIDYIALALRSVDLSTFAKKGAQPSISQEAVYSALIPLPPLAEQRRIVAHLEAVQERLKALKEAQAATEAELKRLEQAILEKAFRGEL